MAKISLQCKHCKQNPPSLKLFEHGQSWLCSDCYCEYTDEEVKK